MLSRIKRIVTDTPLEKIARRFYIRLDQNDRETIVAMRHWLKKSSNCIDIGAHRGSILNEIVSLAPNGTHYAFEPIPRHYQYLLYSFPNVKIYPIALSNKEGLEKFTHDLVHPTRSGFQNLTEANDLAETIMVKTNLLDNIIPPDLDIHFIKLDVEGAELFVLQGGLQTIKRNKPMIIFEHSKQSHRPDDKTSLQIYHLLDGECGLRVSTLHNWVKRRPDLTLPEFLEQVQLRNQYYFIAHQE